VAKKTEPAVKPERLVVLVAGESGTGKSFWVASLKDALIYDTDLGGGLGYLDARIQRNGSERVEVGSYPEVMADIDRRRKAGDLKRFSWIGIDHLTTLQQEAVNRHNPTGGEDYGKSYDKATREWRKIRHLVRVGDFSLICTAHLKSKYENQKVVGITTDASKNINADFSIVLYLQRQASGAYPSQARVEKWRRDPEDPRGPLPAAFPFTIEKVFELHGGSGGGERVEVEMATEGQVREIEGLLNVVKVDEAEVQKWFKKYGAEVWGDFPAADLDRCIKYVKGLLPKDGKAA
jgi:hypothetical protein